MNHGSSWPNKATDPRVCTRTVNCIMYDEVLCKRERNIVRNYTLLSDCRCIMCASISDIDGPASGVATGCLASQAEAIVDDSRAKFGW